MLLQQQKFIYWEKEIMQYKQVLVPSYVIVKSSQSDPWDSRAMTWLDARSDILSDNNEHDHQDS
jgi:hypothetical protein